MADHKALKAEIAELDNKIKNFANDYAAQSYADFIAKGGCIDCDGTGVQRKNAHAFLCTVCNGQTICHPLSFWKLDNTTPYWNHEMIILADSVGLSANNRKTFYSATALAEKDSLIKRRANLWAELTTQPDDNEINSKVSVGDTVMYKSRAFTVVWIGPSLKGEDGPARIGLATGYKRFFVDENEISLSTKFNEKLPELSAVSESQRKFGLNCRLKAISLGKASTAEILHQTSARYWIDNFKDA